jgi:predicted TIM-barrel fold metal-dependent hydrolase
MTTVPGKDGKAGCACCLARRGFLTGLAALGASAVVGAGESAAQAPAVVRKPYRVDVHHHLIPPGYIEETAARRAGSSVKWSPAMSIEDMDRSGIALSMVSLIQPGVWFGDIVQGRRLARQSNEYAAQMRSDYPNRFGSFATIPLPDAEGSLKEIAYALDTLHAEGIGLMTSYGDKYLGDAAFAPVWEELNRRQAVVYTHPLTPACCASVGTGLPPSVIEYATDTTRTIASLVFSGTAARYPDIRWIFSHGGGTTPFLLSRFTREEAAMKERQSRLPRGVMYELKKFYYDTAQANHRGALDALLEIVAPSQVLYGSDFPFRPGAEVNEGLTAYPFSASDRRAIERDNALRLVRRPAA